MSFFNQTNRGPARGGGRFRGGPGRPQGGFHKGPHHQQQQQPQQGNVEKPAYPLCTFYTRGSQCNNGDNCRFAHTAMVAFSIPAHDKQPVHSMGVLSLTDTPMVVTGAHDSIKVWSLETLSPQLTIPTSGKVTNIAVHNNLLVWAADEPLSAEKPEVTVGTVYLCNVNDQKPIPVHRSEEMPYTHAFGEIRSIALLFIDEGNFIVTGGGEGVVRTWKFDPTKNKFEQLNVLEGHVRGVTCVLLNDNLLWTGSLDQTIRVWDVASGRCIGVLSSIAGGKGHTSAITCFTKFLAGPQQELLIASGGADNEVKLWKPNGQFFHSMTHAACVTAMCPFQDALNGIPVLVVGLADGSFVIRSTLTMALLMSFESSFSSNQAIWSIVNLGKSCFATTGDDGNVNVWKIDKAITDKTA